MKSQTFFIAYFLIHSETNTWLLKFKNFIWIHPKVILCTRRCTYATLWEPPHFPMLALQDEQKCGLWRIWIHSNVILCWSGLVCIYIYSKMKMSSRSSQECFLSSITILASKWNPRVLTKHLNEKRRRWIKDEWPSNAHVCSAPWSCHCRLNSTPGTCFSATAATHYNHQRAVTQTRFFIWTQMWTHTV